MQIGEENQAFAEVNVLAFDGLLDLDHHLGLAPGIARIADDLRTCILVLGIGESGLRPGLSFNQHLVASLSERFYPGGRDSDPRLIVLDLFRNADNHGCTSSQVWRDCSAKHAEMGSPESSQGTLFSFFYCNFRTRARLAVQ